MKWLNILKNLRVTGPLIMALLMAVFLLSWRNGVIAEERAEYKTAAASFKRTLLAVRQRHRQELQAITRERQDEIARNIELEEILEGMQGLEDGPVAPVLDWTVGRLYCNAEGGDGQNDSAGCAHAD